MNSNAKKNQDRVSRIESLFISMRRTLFSNNAHHRHMLPSATMSLVRTLADYYSDAKNPMSVGSLIVRSGLSSSSVSQHLDIIEKRLGIIKRRPNAKDKRIIEIVPTKSGEIMLARLHEYRQHSHILQDLIDYLGPDDSDELLRLLERVDEFMNNRGQSKLYD
jgi:DNA-binding MarR family transcriptional regulator